MPVVADVGVLPHNDAATVIGSAVGVASPSALLTVTLTVYVPACGNAGLNVAAAPPGTAVGPPVMVQLYVQDESALPFTVSEQGEPTLSQPLLRICVGFGPLSRPLSPVSTTLSIVRVRRTL